MSTSTSPATWLASVLLVPLYITLWLKDYVWHIFLLWYIACALFRFVFLVFGLFLSVAAEPEDKTLDHQFWDAKRMALELIDNAARVSAGALLKHCSRLELHCTRLQSSHEQTIDTGDGVRRWRR
jgi:hypothetical protein